MTSGRRNTRWSERQQLWSRAARRLIEPLVRALLSEGFRFPELVRILEEATVAAARDDGGKELSAQELAERTGLSVARVRRALAARPQAAAGMDYEAASRLLGRWLEDRRFAVRGRPKPLPLYGPRSFATLAAMAGVEPQAALQSLRQAGVLCTDSQGRVLPVELGYVPAAGLAERLEAAVTSAAEFLRIVLHNVGAPTAARRFFQRRVSYDNIGARALPAARAALKKRSTAATLEVNRLLAGWDRDRHPGAPGGRRKRISFGVYWCEEDVPDRRGRKRGSP